MKRVLFLFLISASVSSGISYASIRACFSPTQTNDCQKEVIGAITNSKEEILLSIYSLTDNDIVSALKEAKNRGIKIRCVYDGTQAKGKNALSSYLVDYGFDCVYKKYGVMHNKYIIVDKQTLITGSYNFTNNARDKNDENALIINNENVINDYINNFNMLYKKYNY